MDRPVKFRALFMTAFLVSSSFLVGCSGSNSGGDAVQLANPPSPSVATAETSTCPDGLLKAVQGRIDNTATLLNSYKGAVVSMGTLDDVQPASLRPQLADACVTKYATKNGDYTYVFSRTASQQEIGDAARSSGYTGSTAPVLSMYQMPIPGKDQATVTVSGTDLDKDFSAFYPKGLAIQTAMPFGSSAPASTAPGAISDPSEGPSAAALPAASVPVSNADRAYCQNRGVLLWLAESANYRGALCSIEGARTLVTMSKDAGGNITLPAQVNGNSFSATGPDGSSYTYGKDAIRVATPSKSFSEPTSAWSPGASSSLAHPGDLGISTAISYPACDESAMVVYGTAWKDVTYGADVQKLLAAHPGSSYMRTDLSCRIFKGPSTDNSDGSYIYAVYSIASSQQAACQEIIGTQYSGRILSNSKEPGENVLRCS